jgi:hypothetical protein
MSATRGLLFAVSLSSVCYSTHTRQPHFISYTGNEEGDEEGKFIGANGKVEIKQRILHEGEVEYSITPQLKRYDNADNAIRIF